MLGVPSPGSGARSFLSPTFPSVLFDRLIAATAALDPPLSLELVFFHDSPCLLSVLLVDAPSLHSCLVGQLAASEFVLDAVLAVFLRLPLVQLLPLAKGS